MARTRIKESILKDWNDVNLTLEEIAENERKIEEIETKLNSSIAELKLEAEIKTQPIRDDIKKLSTYVKEYCVINKDEFDKTRTKQLTFGKVGFRMSTKIVISSVKDVIKKLRTKKMDDCIVVKESINKDILKKYKADDIIAVGASLKTEDTFWYETDRERLLENEQKN